MAKKRKGRKIKVFWPFMVKILQKKFQKMRKTYCNYQLDHV